MRSLLLLFMSPAAHAIVSKTTYAMSHPFVYTKAWMEKFLPTAENVIQEKVIIHKQRIKCGTAHAMPPPNTQLHSQQTLHTCDDHAQRERNVKR